MKVLSFLFFAIAFIAYPLIGQDYKNNKLTNNFSNSKNIDAVKLKVIKQKSEFTFDEEITASLILSALQDVNSITISYKFSRGLKIENYLHNIKIDKINSGESETIPIRIKATEKELQELQIKVSGKAKNNIKGDYVNFKTSETIGLLYNKEEETFTFETSFESMTKEFRIWNLIQEDSLKAKGHKIIFRNNFKNNYFHQANPVEPKIKRIKNLDHKSAYTVIAYDDASNIRNNNILKKGKSQNGIKSSVCALVNGSVFFEDSDGQYVPLANATIEIWEDDTIWDDYLASTITNQTGSFSINICDNDGIGDSHLELYVVIATKNDRVSTLNYTSPGGPYGFDPFKWASYIVSTGGATVNFNNLLISNGTLNRGGAKIFDNMQRAWSTSVSHGFNPSYTPIVYPAPTTICGGSSCYQYQIWPWNLYGVIYIQSPRWQNGDEDVSYHEYGHALMHRAYSNEWYPNSGGGDHEVFPQPAGFAWLEGWATFYTQIVENDGFYLTWDDLENKNDITNSTINEYNEWRVAQALVDLWDVGSDNGEDNSSIVFSKFISTMQSNNSSSLTQFWGQLKNNIPSWQRYYGSESLIYNTIPVTLEPYTFLSVAISGPHYLEFRDKGTWTANVSGGSGSHTYSWYKSHNGGSTWTGPVSSSNTFKTTMLFSDFLLRCDITDSHTNETDSDTHEVEYDDGNIPLPKIAEEKEIQELPDNYALGINYPNPFNPTTTIKYQLKEDGFVSLKVYDILGKEIAKLVNENKNAGFYNTNFDAGNLSSGLYIYRFRVNEFVESKKMLLTK